MLFESELDLQSHELFDTYPVLVYPCKIYDHGAHTGQLRFNHCFFILQFQSEFLSDFAHFVATCFHTGCRPPRADQMVPGTNYGMFNDLGVYGVPRLVRERKRWEADLITLSDLLTDMSDLQQNKKGLTL